MARLFPRIEPREIHNPGERKVAAALVAQLPASVEVFHSFAWLRADRPWVAWFQAKNTGAVKNAVISVDV